MITTLPTWVPWVFSGVGIPVIGFLAFIGRRLYSSWRKAECAPAEPTTSEIPVSTALLPNIEVVQSVLSFAQPDKLTGVWFENSTSYPALIVEFRNKPGAVGTQTCSCGEATANLVFIPTSGGSQVTSNFGTWVGRDMNYAPFNSGQMQRLIVAVDPGNGNVPFLLENSTHTPVIYIGRRRRPPRIPRIKSIPLSDSSYTVEITLVDHDITIFRGKFLYKWEPDRTMRLILESNDKLKLKE